MQDVNNRRWELGAGCWALGTWYWVLGAGFWVLGARCWVLGAGNWVLGGGKSFLPHRGNISVESRMRKIFRAVGAEVAMRNKHLAMGNRQ